MAKEDDRAPRADFDMCNALGITMQQQNDYITLLARIKEDNPQRGDSATLASWRAIKK